MVGSPHNHWLYSFSALDRPGGDVSSHTDFDSLGIIGTSPAFRKVLTRVARFAASEAPVLIFGETGTGKELVARAVHYMSARAGKPFVPVNCGALPEALIENELFGHQKGAFTDAVSRQRGLVAMAEGGTLMLDEVNTLSARGQVALLRFVQERRYRPIGAEKSVATNLRIVAATNADLPTLVEQGDFRADLLFRLDVGTVRLPPLRDRGCDALLLAEHQLRRHASENGWPVPKLGARAKQAILAYDWPGNVRELENAMYRAAILCEGGVIEDVPLGILARRSAHAPTDFEGGLRAARARCVAQFEREYLSWLLDECSGNITHAACRAGTERRHLGRMIKRLGLVASTFGP